MPSIELHILTGSHAGRRLLLEQSSITIGRSADNDVVLDLPYVSRLHAELRFADGQWWLVNHSPNGTRVQHRRVTDEPRPIEDAASISIGDARVLEVAPQLAAATGEGDEDDANGTSGETRARRPGGGLSRRAMLWIGIGTFNAIIVGLIIFSFTLEGNDNTASNNLAPELTHSEIANEIRREPAPQPPNPDRAAAAIDEASDYFNARDRERSARYQALKWYRTAIAYRADHELPGIHQLRYTQLQDTLITRIESLYRSAYADLQANRYRQAYSKFDELMQMYPAGDERDNVVFNRIEQHAAHANPQLRE